MQLKTTKEIWDKIIPSYEGDDQVKCAKLQSLIIQYETLKMHNDESVANYFLRIDEIVNHMKNLGEEIKEITLVEKVLRSSSSKFESKVSTIEEKQNLQSITMSQLHEILTSFEMRKQGPSDMKEVAFKASGKEEYSESGHTSKGEEESNFVKNLQWDSRRFRGKLPFKCFACGRVSHYAAKCPHKDKLDKGKEPVKWNRKQNVSKKSYYTHEDNDGLSNSDEDEHGNGYRLWMDFEDDDFLDVIDEDDLYEEVSKLKICLEENSMIIDTLTFQLAEREKHNEKLECEIVGLRKDIEKTKALNLIFAQGSETLDGIIKVQCSPLIKTGLGYTEEASQAQKPSTSKSFLDVTRRSEQVDNRQQRHKADHQKEQASLGPKTWRKKEPQPERCGIALYVEGQENQWHTDSGCSKNMTGDKEKPESYSSLEKERKVSFGNDTPALIKGKGSVLLKEKIKARNVMYVDGLKHNLLSVSQMCDQGNEVVFQSNGCIVRELDTGETMIKEIRTPNNLYILKGGKQQCYLSKNDEHWIWYRGLGHLSFPQIRKASKYQVKSKDFEDDDEDFPSTSNQTNAKEETYEAPEEEIRVEEKNPSRYV
eukprot:PITA_34859